MHLREYTIKERIHKGQKIVVFKLRMLPEMHTDVKKLAIELGSHMNDLMCAIILKYLRERKNEPKET